MAQVRSYTIQTFDELKSTNLYALDNIGQLDNATVIVAKSQSHGRGRLQRNWFSESRENIYLSIVLKPSNSLSNNLPLSNLTQYMAVVVAKLLETYTVSSQIKWPNDILINNKKIAGILCETKVRGTHLEGVVLGIGLNLKLGPDDLKKIDQPATALNLELGANVDKNIFVSKMLDLFFERYDVFLEKGFLEIRDDYIQRCNFIGKVIKVRNLNEIVEGYALDVNNNGALVFKNSRTNKVEQLFTGDLLC